jgi:processive 1,2-diacylglycerol beta-glucosyltransferase
MLNLYECESGELIGTLTQEELRYLIAELEEEDSEDQDYYIDRASLDWFEEHGADADLMAMLRKALGDREGMDVRWAKT